MTALQPTITTLALTLALVLSAGACSRETLVAHPSTIAQQGNSCDRRLGYHRTGHLIYFHVDLPYGTQAKEDDMDGDKRAVVRRTYLRPDVVTRSTKAGPMPAATLWRVLTVVLLLLGGGTFLAVAVQQILRARRKMPLSPARLLGVGTLGVALLGGGVAAGSKAGGVMGSEVVIDNASQSTVDVLINGKPMPRLGPRRFLRTHVKGENLLVEVRKDGRLVEQMAAKLNLTTTDRFRAAFGLRGAHLYNICGVNRYGLMKATYKKMQ